jgi:hypothetical protein
LKKVQKSDKKDEIKKAVDDLNQVIQKIGQAMYGSSQGGQAGSQGPQAGAQAGPKTEEKKKDDKGPVDAQYEEVKK